MKGLFSFCFIITIGSLAAQSNLLRDGKVVFADSTQSLFFTLEGNGYVGNSALDNAFLKKFLYGGEITDSDKDRVEKQMKLRNNSGVDVSTELTSAWLPFGKSSGWQLAIGTVYTQRIAFNKDLFTLIFRGNEPFGASPAILSESQSEGYFYSKIQFGKIFRSTGSGFRVGIYSGQAYNHADFNQTSLSTQYETADGFTYADRIRITTTGISTTTTDQKSSLFNNGIGIGADANWNIPSIFGMFTLAFSDLGFMRWTHLSGRDTIGTIDFQGFEITSSNDGGLLFVSDNLVDSLLPEPHVKKDQNIILPTLLSATFVSNALKKTFTSASISYRYRTYPLPRISGAVNYQFQPGNVVWLNASLGGFEKYGFGLGAQIRCFSNSFITVETRNAVSWFDPNGHALSIGFQYIQRL